MSGIFYNEVGLTLIQTKRFMQENIKIGQDVAGIRYTATVLANCSRLTMGGDPGDNSGRIIPSGPTVSGMEVWDSLRELLMTPRKPFVYNAGTTGPGAIQLANFGVAPGQASLPDIELGPKPLACNAIQFNGGGSVLVEYTIQWTVPNPCPGRDIETKQAVLSHAWAAEDDIDPDFFISRTYTGRVRFNPNLVGAASRAGAAAFTPDSFKRFLLPPLAPGMFRVKVWTKQSEDGITYDYRIDDKQPRALVNSAEITRMTAEHRIRTTTPSPLDVLGGQRKLAMGIAGGFAAAVTATLGTSQTVGAVAAGVANPHNLATALKTGIEGAQMTLGAITSSIGAHFDIAESQYMGIPITTHTLNVTAYGRPTTPYATLTQAARIVAVYRLMRAANLPAGMFYGSVEQHDTADPKASTVVCEFFTRPRDFNAPPLTPAQRWNASGTQMPTLGGGGLTPVPITSPDGAPVPVGMQAILFGGTLGAGDAWGWGGVGFAPDLISATDAGVHGWQPLGVQPNNSPFITAYMAALQDPCSSVAGYSPGSGLRPNFPTPVAGGPSIP